jgi:hypothetical protein
MAIDINLRRRIDNVSLQLGDTLYYVNNVVNSSGLRNSSSLPIKIGKLTNFDDGGTSLTVNNNVNTSTPQNGDFLMFSKDKSANNTSLLGYYAEVTIANDSTEEAELYSLGSEVAVSSK